MLFKNYVFNLVWCMHVIVYFGVSRSMTTKASSPPNLTLLPLHAENAAIVMLATLTHVRQRSKWRVCNPFVDDEVEEGK